MAKGDGAEEVAKGSKNPVFTTLVSLSSPLVTAEMIAARNEPLFIV